jgi:hypothetical protein
MDPLKDVWKLKRGEITPGPAELPRLFERYLHAVHGIAGAVDTLVEKQQQ